MRFRSTNLARCGHLSSYGHSSSINSSLIGRDDHPGAGAVSNAPFDHVGGRGHIATS